MIFADLLRRLFLLTLLLCSAWSDMSEGKIQNRLVLFGFAFCGVFNCFFPPNVSVSSVMGVLSVILVLLLLRRFHLIGGGDIKLIMLVLWILPEKAALYVTVFTFPAALLMWTLKCFMKEGKGIPLAVCLFVSAVLVFTGGLIK